MKRLLISAMALLLGISAASAAGVPQPVAPILVQIADNGPGMGPGMQHRTPAAPQKRYKRPPPPRHQAKRSPAHQTYRPGGKYRQAPHGWRRYGARPGNWQTRGCVTVGPVWFCP